MSHAIHIWSRCHYCGISPITGACFRCETCPLGPEIDLCSSCYEGYLAGRVVHPAPDITAPVGAPRAHRFARSQGSPSEQFASWLKMSCTEQAPPPVPPGFLVRPEFRSERESAFGGYGFVIWFEGEVLLLTALHVMDEVIKNKGIDTTARNPRYTGEELPAYVSSVRLYNVLKNQWPMYELGDAGPMMVLPNARTADDEPFSFRDIAAFRVGSLGVLNPGGLAEKEPEPGEPVWLAGAMPDGSRTRRAVCVERTPRSFVFRYEEGKELPKHSSGAPILDRYGAVAGINTGYGCFAGREFGHANPRSSICAHLEGALSASPPRSARGASEAEYLEPVDDPSGAPPTPQGRDQTSAIFPSEQPGPRFARP